MFTQAFPYSSIYNDADKVQRYRGKLKPAGVTDKSYCEKWETQIPFLEQISSQHCVQVLLWNVISNHFIYEVDKRNVAGYDASLYLADNGVDFLMSTYHPYFLTGILVLLRKGFEYLIANKQHVKNVVLNVDGMYKKSNGEYMHFLQQSKCIEADHNGYPRLILSYVHDITYLKKEKSINLVITTPDEIEWWNFNFVTNTPEPVQPLSRQEKKILAHLANGKSSKGIAKELFISPHTIDTHRKHLLHKTSCIDTSGMITYTKLVGLL